MYTQKAAADTIIINVDLTNDFMPGGALGHPEGDQIVPTVNWLTEQFQKVAWTLEEHDEHHDFFASSREGKNPLDTIETNFGTQFLWPDHCVTGTDGTKFHPDLNVKDEHMKVVKGTDKEIHAYSAFLLDDRKTEIVYPDGKTMTEKLKDEGIKRVFVTGLLHDFCAGLTAVDAAIAGFEVYFVEDASKSLVLPSLNDPDKTTVDEIEELFAKHGVKKVKAADVPAIIGTIPSTPCPALKAA